MGGGPTVASAKSYIASPSVIILAPAIDAAIVEQPTDQDTGTFEQ